MVKLVDTSDLKSAAAGRAGSIPARGTIFASQALPSLLKKPRWHWPPGLFCSQLFSTTLTPSHYF